MSTPEQDETRPHRNRIVIDLGQRPGAAPQPAQEQGRARGHVTPPISPRVSPERRGGGALKILAVVAVLLFLIVVGVAIAGYFWWNQHKATPAYSLALLVDSVQHDNMQQFDEIVDTDGVVKNLIPQIVDAASKRYGVVADAGLRKQIEEALPAVMPGIKQYVREEVARQAKEISARGANYPFPLVVLGVPYFAQITEEGDAAKAAVQYQDRNIELTMQRAGDERWKIVGVRDDTLTARIIDRVAQDLPSAGSQIEQTLRKHLGNLPGGLQDLLNGDNSNGKKRR